jgi:hypothetical protein
LPELGNSGVLGFQRQTNNPPAGCSDRFILKNIYCRLNKNANIQEVWTYEKGKVRLLFKNKKTGK